MIKIIDNDNRDNNNNSNKDDFDRGCDVSNKDNTTTIAKNNVNNNRKTDKQ